MDSGCRSRDRHSAKQIVCVGAVGARRATGIRCLSRPFTGTHAGARRLRPGGKPCAQSRMVMPPGAAGPGIARSSRNPGAIPHGHRIGCVQAIDRGIDAARLEVGMLGHRGGGPVGSTSSTTGYFVVAVGEDDLRLVGDQYSRNATAFSAFGGRGQHTRTRHVDMRAAVVLVGEDEGRGVSDGVVFRIRRGLQATPVNRYWRSPGSHSPAATARIWSVSPPCGARARLLPDAARPFLGSLLAENLDELGHQRDIIDVRGCAHADQCLHRRDRPGPRNPQYPRADPSRHCKKITRARVVRTVPEVVRVAQGFRNALGEKHRSRPAGTPRLRLRGAGAPPSTVNRISAGLLAPSASMRASKLVAGNPRSG